MSPRKRRSDIRKEPHRDPRLAAAVELIGRTGADQFQIWFCEEEKPPLVWIAAALYEDTWECAASVNPLRALFRLCDQLIDGGECLHCKRPTGFVPDIEPTIMNEFVCWYQWDPELKTFRRGCAGDGK